MPKKIVICCDGTGNQIEANLSNVLKLYRTLTKNDEQVVFYDPGIGTIGTLNLWSRIKQKSKQIFCLATGYGLDENILTAYRFLIDTYADGDEVFLFGFSRGAYTVRAVAGLVCLIGLLKREQKNLAEHALTAYKQVNLEGNFEAASRFREITRARKISIHFMGVWDTVSSVFVPRPDRLYIPSMQKLPYTAKNSRVKAFRHAIAIDERRRLFRLNKWTEDQTYQMNDFDDSSAVPQDARQVWFAGVHADVGGGYPETESAIAKFPLIWMIKEAEKHGLKVEQTMVNHLVFGKPRAGGKKSYTPADALGMQHNSMAWLWRVAEIFPKLKRSSEWPERKKAWGIYIPWAEPRYIPEGATLHHTVVERMEKLSSYKPVNIPKSYITESAS